MTHFTPSGAIFDFDGTLLSNEIEAGKLGTHERLRLEAVQEIGRKYGLAALITATGEQSRLAFETVQVTAFANVLWNMLCILGVRHNPDEPDFGDPLMVEITNLKDQRYQQYLGRSAVEVPGSTEFVRHMASVVDGYIAIGSSARRDDIETYLATKQLSNLLPTRRITSIENVTRTKPDPEVYIRALETLDLPKHLHDRVCVFEDDPRGIMAAKAAGLYACAITTRYSKTQLLSLEVKPDIVADSYEEFTEILLDAIPK